MRTILKSLAVAGLMASTSTVAFADAHMNVDTMTCAEYKALSPEDQMTMAAMVVAELETNAEGSNQEATATAEIGGNDTAESTDGAENTTVAENNGEATATEGTVGSDTETQMTEEVERLMTICDQNLDAQLIEAAAGLEGTR